MSFSSRDLGRDRVIFQRRIDHDDGYGNTVAEWQTQFERPAKFLMRPGNDAFTAARLEGRAPRTVIVRLDAQTRQVRADWRMIDARSGEAMNIRGEPQDMERTGRWLSITCEVGTAT